MRQCYLTTRGLQGSRNNIRARGYDTAKFHQKNIDWYVFTNVTDGSYQRSNENQTDASQNKSRQLNLTRDQRDTYRCFYMVYYHMQKLQKKCLKSTCDVNLLSKLSIIFKEWRVMNNGELLFSLYFRYYNTQTFFCYKINN